MNKRIPSYKNSPKYNARSHNIIRIDNNKSFSSNRYLEKVRCVLNSLNMKNIISNEYTTKEKMA